MVTFAHLPNEVIGMILRLVPPEDLERFAQTEKVLPVVAEPILREHRAYIRKYSTLSNVDE